MLQSVVESNYVHLDIHVHYIQVLVYSEIHFWNIYILFEHFRFLVF